MSSFIRNLQRKHLRQGTFTTDDDGTVVKKPHQPKPQLTTMMPDGGYVTVRYTKGPLRISAARYLAQVRTAVALDNVVMPRPKRPKKARRKDAAPIAGTVTRQQIRFARRKGLPIPGAEPTAKPKRARKPRAAAAQAA